jgi:hypothetical protein
MSIPLSVAWRLADAHAEKVLDNRRGCRVAVNSAKLQVACVHRTCPFDSRMMYENDEHRTDKLKPRTGLLLCAQGVPQKRSIAP